jgi:hypothetical protein
MKVLNASTLRCDRFATVDCGSLEAEWYLWKLISPWTNPPEFSVRNFDIEVLGLSRDWDVGFLRGRVSGNEMPIYLVQDTSHRNEPFNTHSFLLPAKFDIWFNRFLDSPDDDTTANAELLGLILEQTGDGFRRTGMFSMLSCRQAELLSGLSISEPSRRIRCIGDQARLQGVFVPGHRTVSKDQSNGTEQELQDRFWRRDTIKLL